MPHFLANTPDEGIGNIVGVGSNIGIAVGVETAVGIAVGVGTDGVLVEGNIWGTTWTVIVGVTAGSFVPQATAPKMLTASNKNNNGLMLVIRMNG